LLNQEIMFPNAAAFSVISYVKATSRKPVLPQQMRRLQGNTYIE